MSVPHVSALRKILFSSTVLAGLIFGGVAQATVVSVGAEDFTASRSLIGFDQLSPGTRNPAYSSGTDPSAGASVTFAGLFDGQTVGDVSSCGAIGCARGLPDRGLALNQSSTAYITLGPDGSGNQVLSGELPDYPAFVGPISILFGTDQSGVGLDAASGLAGTGLVAGAVRLTAFDREGNVLASTENTASAGASFLGLASLDGDRAIAGVQIQRTGAGMAGYDIDTVIFGGPDAIASAPPPPAPVPAPSNLWLFGIGVLAMGALARRRGRQQLVLRG